MARRNGLFITSSGWVAMTGTGIRNGLAALLISTVKNDSIFGPRTGIVRSRLPPDENSTFGAAAKRCVAVVVSDKVDFTCMTG